jgi:hypothetical protein
MSSPLMPARVTRLRQFLIQRITHTSRVALALAIAVDLAAVDDGPAAVVCACDGVSVV